MKILLDSRQMKQCDKNTIEHFGVPSLVLMERAALSTADEIDRYFREGGKKGQIQERQAARKARDFARADEIRDTLAAQGIILEDTREGVKWKRA